jgi:hypothetical protein
VSWQGVRPKKRPLLNAAVEDAERRIIIYAADAPLAVFLADVLNDEERGEPLPPAGEQHFPRRFQLVHDKGMPFAAAPGTGVIYQNRMKGRIVAWAPDDETASRIARLLNLVDYPMNSSGALIPQMGALRDVPDELPPSVLDPPS